MRRAARLQAVDGLQVVRKHVQAGARQVPHGAQVAGEVGRQALHQRLRPQRLQRAHLRARAARAAALASNATLQQLQYLSQLCGAHAPLQHLQYLHQLCGAQAWPRSGAAGRLRFMCVRSCFHGMPAEGARCMYALAYD